MAPPWTGVLSSAPSGDFLSCSFLPLRLCLLLCCLSLSAGTYNRQESTLEISALSRPLDLGMLYNAKTDQLIPGVSLWDTEEMKGKIAVSPQPNTRFQVAMSETLRQKMNLLEVSASVKTSFLGGLVEVGGSAKYLNEKSSSTHQCSVTLKYHVTTEFKELMITELKTPDPGVFGMTDATHVVVGVLYGGDALMEFQERISDNSQRQEIGASLYAMVNSIVASVSVKGRVKLKSADREKAKNLRCKFFGDTRLENLPSTYEEAVEVYRQLPTLLGNKGGNVVPLKVWLYPLSKLHDTKIKLKRMISETLVAAIETVMEDLHHAEIKTNDLLECSKKIKAEDITSKLEKFQSNLRVFTVEFLRKLAGLIPAIRGGDMEETALRDLLSSQDAAGFSGDEMERWLDEKEAEINVVGKYIEKIQSSTIKSPGAELLSFLMNPDVKDAFVFSFTSLSYEEPYLEKTSQAKIFKNGSTISTPGQQSTKEVPWYRKVEIKKALDSALYGFNKITCKNKVISFIPDPKYPGISVQWYDNAVQKDPHLMYTYDLTLDPNTAYKRLQLSNGYRKVTSLSKDVYYLNHPHRFTNQLQVQSREPLTGHSYWEWDWDMRAYAAVGVAYKSISRSTSILHTGQAWVLFCHIYHHTVYYEACHKSCTRVNVPPILSRTVGVHLNREAGTLSFYSVLSYKMTLIHTFTTKFTHEPLYAVFHVGCGSSVSVV